MRGKANQVQDAPFQMSWKSEKPPEGRKTITRSALEQTLVEAVRTGDPECEAFVGVLIERLASAQKGGPNWIVKGVRYGKVDRSRCNALLTKCVEDAQLEFDVSE
jgi:hypothetical protein